VRKKILLGVLALGSPLAWGATASWGQLVVPSSYPGTLAAPTSSILLKPADITGLQAWWNAPVAGDQTTIKNNVIYTANQSLAFSAPSDLNATTAQATIVQARALRWVLTGNGDTSNADFTSVKSVLTNYAASAGGSDITAPLSSKGYAVAFDLINGYLTSGERSAIQTRLQNNVVSKLGSPSPANNHAVINYAARGLYAILLGNQTNLNSAMSGFAGAYNNVTTNDGFFTDGDRYQNYTLGTTIPFMTAYINGSGDAAGSAQFVNAAEQMARYAIGIRMPNGISPSFHNSDNMPIVVQEFSRLVQDPNLKAATLWYANQLNGANWAGATNAFNNQWVLTDLMTTTATDVSAAAPNWSPTYFSGGQARISVFRNDWGTSSNYLATTAGVDGNIGSFAHADTGAITLAANGTQVIVEPGYARYNGVFGIGADGKMPNTPPGGSPNLDTSVATEHNVLLARNTGTGSWGVGDVGKNITQTSANETISNRLDSAERGNFKGVVDFSTLKSNYGTAGAGANVHERRSTGMINESATSQGYMVMADSFRSTNATNKDFALNLIGKSTAANTQVMVDQPDYKKLRWSVDSYLGDYSSTDSPSTPTNYITAPPYNQPVSGQVIAHVVSSVGMNSVAQDSSWMVENWGVFIKTQRLRVSVSNANRGAFLTFFETGPANFTSKWNVTPLSGTDYAAARIDNAAEAWNDWHLSQTSASDVLGSSAGGMVSIDSGALVSDGQYAYLRRTGAQQSLDSVFISRGTTITSGGQSLFAFSNPVTASLLFSQMDVGELLGTLSMDDFIGGTVLTLANLPGVIDSVLYNGAPLAGFTDDSVSLPYISGVQSVPLVISFNTAVPEPGIGLMLVAASAGLLRRRRRRVKN